MKKVIIAHDIYGLLRRDSDFLAWKEVTLFRAASTDEALDIHRTEHVNLIIIQQDMPGMNSTEFCSRIRGNADLRAVSIIILCENNLAAVEESLRCRVNSILLRPVHPLVLMTKARQLVDVPTRSAYSEILNVRIDGQRREENFFCRARNISAAGVLIETERVLADGTRLHCSFPLDDSANLVHASAKVIRIIEKGEEQAGHQYGLMFTDLAPEVKQMLADYVRKTSPQSS